MDAAVPLEEFWTLLEAALAAPSAAGAGAGARTRVRRRAGLALGIDFPLTIVPGLVEGGFPAAPRQDPILLDAERRRLRVSRSAEEARALERVRFALAVGSGARRVLLTYPRMDAESGRPRVPSFLVLDLLEAVTGERHDFRPSKAFPGWRTVPLHPAPPTARERPLDEREWLVTRALEARPGPRRCSGSCRTPVAVWRRSGLRERTDALTAYDGLLGQGVDLGDAAMAPTALERYAACPFRFLLERVYGLEAVEEPDRILMMDPRDRGDIAHAVLEATFRAWRRGGACRSRGRVSRPRRMRSTPRSPRSARKPSAGADRAAGALGGRAGAPSGGAPVRAGGRGGRSGRGGDPAGWRPARFEVAFGIEGSEAAARRSRTDCPTARHRPPWPDRPGRRVSRRPAKHGSSTTRRAGSGALRTPDRLARGRALQLPLYRLAAEALLCDAGGTASVDEAQYYHVIGPDAGTRVRFTRAGWEIRRADFDRVLTTIVGGIRAGRFFQRPGVVRARPVRLRPRMRRRARAVGGGQARRSRGRDPRDPRGDRVTRPPENRRRAVNGPRPIGVIRPAPSSTRTSVAARSRTSTPPSWSRPPRAAGRRRCSSAAS